MNIWTDIFIPYILPLIGTLISALGTWLAKVLIDWFNEKIKKPEIANGTVHIKPLSVLILKKEELCKASFNIC